jgi:citrate lyase alpha subunit
MKGVSDTMTAIAINIAMIISGNLFTVVTMVDTMIITTTTVNTMISITRMIAITRRREEIVVEIITIDLDLVTTPKDTRNTPRSLFLTTASSKTNATISFLPPRLTRGTFRSA